MPIGKVHWALSLASVSQHPARGTGAPDLGHIVASSALHPFTVTRTLRQAGKFLSWQPHARAGERVGASGARCYRTAMKLTAERPYADPEKAARKLIEIGNATFDVI
jgi:hypothetical protein